jgi:hypothetical protein
MLLELVESKGDRLFPAKAETFFVFVPDIFRYLPLSKVTDCLSPKITEMTENKRV